MTSDLSTPEVFLHIGGERRSSGAGGVHEHVYPVDGTTNGMVPLAGPSDVDDAVRAAERALERWRRWRPERRREVLVRLAELIEADRDELSRVSVLDNGMTYSMARFTASTLVDYAKYYAGWADKIEGRVTSTPGSGRELAYTLPEPFGVVGIIITWNGPLVSVGMKIIPALAAGNTIVVKPSELTPFAMERFMHLVCEAGIPDGVVNLLPGDREAGEALVRHPSVQKISFTGGPTTARRILATCAESLKPAVLELGGKSANLVFPDADLDAVTAVSTLTVHEALAGQGCAIASRLLVHADIYEELAQKVADRVASLTAGDPFDPGTTLSPVVTRAAQTRITAMIDRAKADGTAQLLAGGSTPAGAVAAGFYVDPTLFGNVVPDSEIAQVEVFGPVLTMIPFSDEAEAVAIANATSYGLASYAWTNDVRRVNRLASDLLAGGLYVNGAMPVTGPELPFGGIGISGFGKEGGLEGLTEFIRTKAIAVA